MRLAFYAPMKPPGHPVPSGDRAMALALICALERIGAEVTLASTLVTRDGVGDAAVQTRLMQDAAQQVSQAIAAGRAAGWQAWITYHNYYKAPDLIGPAVALALGIPYLQIESTRARKRLTGPWARFAEAAEAASDAAAVIFCFTAHDTDALRRDAPQGQHLIRLRPFMNRDDLPPAGQRAGPMISVAMMRTGDKLASYRIMAQTLALLEPDTWRLDIVGDGPMRGEVTAMMACFGGAVTFRGELEGDALARAYQQAGLLFWPGVNEAFGLVYLEAQAAGLPVVAQDRPGVRDVLAPAAYPTPEAGPPALAARLAVLLRNEDARRAAGDAARAHVAAHHLRPAAAETLRAGLAAVGVAP